MKRPRVRRRVRRDLSTRSVQPARARSDSEPVPHCDWAHVRIVARGCSRGSRSVFDPKREIDAALLRHRRLFGYLALFSAVINGLMLAPSLYMMQVFDRVLTSRNETTLAMLTGITLVLFALGAGLEWTRGLVLVRMSAAFDAELGPRVHDAAFARCLAERGANPSQALADLTTLRQFATGPGLLALLDAPWLPFYAIAAFLFHPWLGVFTLAGVAILATLALWNEAATRTEMAEANRLSVSASSALNASFQNAEVIHALGMLGDLRARWSAAQRRILSAQLRASDAGARIGAITRGVRVAWQSLSLGLGALLALEGEITPGMMIAVSILSSRAMAPAELAIGSWKPLANARAAYARLTQLLAEYAAPAQPMELPAPTGRVRVEALAVAPPGAERAVITGIGFALERGDVLAIVGPSAAGKSTLARALVGVWPAREGCVRLDDADLAQWPRGSLGPHVGYLPQDTGLFQGSVADNIARFGALDSQRVIEAAALAGIHEMVLRLPNGYDTLLGPGGAGLSGGQLQRLGLARAVYGRPALVVLDEPNANLDDVGEASLVKAILALKAGGSTVVLVTHRPSVLAVVDKLLLLKNGTQQLFGPRDVVLRAVVAATQPPADAPASVALGAAG